MPTVTERPGSPQVQRDSNENSATTLYIVEDATSELEATVAVLSHAPIQVSVGAGAPLYRKSIRTADVAPGIWESEVTYSTRAIATAIGGSPTVEEDFEGGTQRIFQGWRTFAAYGTSGQLAISNDPSPIGATPDGIEGIDVELPAWNLRETHRFAAASFTTAYKQALFRATKKVNINPWRGFDVGEVFFKGPTIRYGGSESSGEAAVDVTFTFACLPNALNVPIGNGITVPQKYGWQFLDVLYEPAQVLLADGSSVMGQKPRLAILHDIYQFHDFGQLGIGI